MKYLFPLFGAVLFGNAACADGTVTSPRAQISCPADVEFANLVAAAPVVLIGKMDVDKQRLMDESLKPSPDYLEFSIQIDSVVKGSGEFTSVRYYPKDASYKPSINSLLDAAGSPVVLFLTRVGGKLYFAGYTPKALMLAKKETVGATRAEVSRQTEIAVHWRPDASLPEFNTVRSLIKRLGNVEGKEQQKVFEQLEALGSEAVPAIIAQMDDKRTLKTSYISLVNHSPDAFEAIRQYGPEQVVDGVDAVLSQITNQSFGSIVNGGTDSERNATVAGWRVYATDLACRGK